MQPPGRGADDNQSRRPKPVHQVLGTNAGKEHVGMPREPSCPGYGLAQHRRNFLVG